MKSLCFHDGLPYKPRSRFLLRGFGFLFRNRNSYKCIGDKNQWCVHYFRVDHVPVRKRCYTTSVPNENQLKYTEFISTKIEENCSPLSYLRCWRFIMILKLKFDRTTELHSKEREKKTNFGCCFRFGVGWWELVPIRMWTVRNAFASCTAKTHHQWNAENNIVQVFARCECSCTPLPTSKFNQIDVTYAILFSLLTHFSFIIYLILFVYRVWFTLLFRTSNFEGDIRIIYFIFFLLCTTRRKSHSRVSPACVTKCARKQKESRINIHNNRELCGLRKIGEKKIHISQITNCVWACVRASREQERI